MSVKSVNVLFLLAFVLFKVKITKSVIWQKIRCSPDGEASVPEGAVPDIGRFPWLGVVQHHFYVGGKTRFAITTAVLIHPAYAIAAAEDVGRIPRSQLQNNTKLILWRNSSIKYALDVTDYALHPEYEERTSATIALLELFTTGETGVGENSAPVLPVCLPVSGAGTLADLYAVKFTDETAELQKEVYKMTYVDDKSCDAFYNNHGLSYKKMTPAISICAKSERASEPCVWDGGVALVTQQSWGFWTLIGLGVRGPGCGAPARFLNMMDYLPWLTDMLTQQPVERTEDVLRLGLRRLSPVALQLYSANVIRNTETGQCESWGRGNVLYKDSFELLTTSSFAQGFFYMVITQVADFRCAIVKMEDVPARSNAAVWIEHYCHREIMGTSPNNKPRDYRKTECFLYFKSAAFIHFRFQFSFKAVVEVVMYGQVEHPKMMPVPFDMKETTDDWYPTNTLFNYNVWYTFWKYYWHH